jgi:hypothetical protein
MNDNTEFVLRAEKFWVSILVTTRIFCYCPEHPDPPVAHPAFYSDGTLSPFSIVKGQVREHDHSLPPNAENMNL